MQASRRDGEVQLLSHIKKTILKQKKKKAKAPGGGIVRVPSSLEKGKSRGEGSARRDSPLLPCRVAASRQL